MDMKPSVYFQRRSITEIQVDCIVSSASPKLAHQTRVAQAIAQQAGRQLRDSCESFIKSGNILRITDVFVSPGGHLAPRRVLHAAVPHWRYYNGDSIRCESDLTRTFLTCLTTAHRLEMKSIALPFIGTGLADIPKHICISGYLKAMETIQHLYKSHILKPILRDVFFVDINDSIVRSFERMQKQSNYTMDHEELMVNIQCVMSLLNDVSFSMYSVNGDVKESRAQISNKENGSTFGTFNGYQNVQNNHKVKNGPMECLTTNNQKQLKGYSEEKQKFLDETNCSISANSSSEIGAVDDFDESKIGAVDDFDESDDREACFIEDEVCDTAIISLSGNISLEITTYFASKFTSDVIVVIGHPFEELMPPYVHSSADKHHDEFNEPPFDSFDFENLLCIPMLHKTPDGLYQTLMKLPEALKCHHRRLRMKNKDIKSMVITSKVLYGDVNNEMAAGICNVLLAVLQSLPRSLNQVFVSMNQSNFHAVCEEFQLIPQHSLPCNKTGDTNVENKDEKDEEDILCNICTEVSVDGLVKLPCCGFALCKVCQNRVERCPSCYKAFSIFNGNQPDGKMSCSFSHRKLPGEADCCGSIEIQYSFDDGIQSESHSHPGQRFSGTTRSAYLPASDEGIKVLKLLRLSFMRRLTFTVGRSVSTGEDNCVTWNDIHHKTKISDGTYGYPDATYLSRVQSELGIKGVELSNMTNFEKQSVEKFISPIIRRLRLS